MQKRKVGTLLSVTGGAYAKSQALVPISPVLGTGYHDLPAGLRRQRHHPTRSATKRMSRKTDRGNRRSRVRQATTERHDPRRSSDPYDESEDPSKPARARKPTKSHPCRLRIIGGSMRGRGVTYHGGQFTRPMKDSVRENLFNILGRTVRGSHVFDLFSGTAALSFEAISRGAARVTAVEQSRQASRVIRESAERLGVSEKMTVITGDTFRLARKILSPPESDTPWIVFLSPPYAMWEEAPTLEKLNAIIRTANAAAPPGSVIVVETDKRVETESLFAGDWDFRVYGNVRLGFLEPAMTCGLE